MMLKIKPNCEHCNIDLPADSADAKICSFECTFCNNCVDRLLENCCPNCGGGFQSRPIRPAVNFKNDNFLGKYPEMKQRIYQSVDLVAHAKLVKKVNS